MATTSAIVTYEEWLRLPVGEDREEVVRGEIRRMPPNKRAHARIVQRLVVLLAKVFPEPAFEVVGSSFGIVIRKEPLTCCNPDLAVFRVEDVVEIDGYYRCAPLLAIELLSPSNTRREMDERFRDYEQIGAPELWVVSSEARTLEVLRLSGGRLRTAEIRNCGGLHPERSPDASVTVEDIWPGE